MVQQDRVFREYRAAISRAVCQWKVELLRRIEWALGVQALALVIVHETQQDQLVDLIDVLVYNQAIELMNVQVQLVLTLDLVMLLGEDLLGDLGLSQLMHSRENQD